jgi:ABC-2 type transport system ATP-binding protein
MIRINQVSKRFGRRTLAVDKVSLEIPEGDSVALWGANGAGKSTLIRCALGLLRFKGAIEIGGRDVHRHGKQARMLVGYVPQELGFYDDLRVAEALTFFARLKGMAGGGAGDELERVGLVGHDRKRIRELSGGMKQRLALAIAMLGDPPVLILDEVTASLDACGRDEFVALLKRLSGAGRTMLFASHRVEEVTTLAQRIVMLDGGKVTGEVGPEEFVNRLGLGALLRLTVPPQTQERAMASLVASGFSPRLNGVGLLVPVPREQKAAPLRVLAEAHIAISDFDIITTRSSQEAH